MISAFQNSSRLEPFILIPHPSFSVMRLPVCSLCALGISACWPSPCHNTHTRLVGRSPSFFVGGLKNSKARKEGGGRLQHFAKIKHQLKISSCSWLIDCMYYEALTINPERADYRAVAARLCVHLRSYKARIRLV